MRRLLPEANNPNAMLRILIVRVGAMGDVLHGMPAVAALRAALPHAHIAWAIEPRWAPLLQTSNNATPHTPAMPLVDHVHLVRAKEWSRAPLSLTTAHSVASLRRELRNEHYDIAIDLQGAIRSSVIASMSSARRIVGSSQPRERLARWLYTERVPLTTKHVVEHAAELISYAIRTALKPILAPLPIDPAAEQWCDTFMPKDEPTVFLAPTAGWGAKQWPAERFGEVALGLSERGYRVLVNASPSGTDETAEAVIASSGNTASAAPCTIPQLIALLRRVKLVIAGDSGPLHLAAALQTPVVALFGPTDPARNGPWSTPSRLLRHASSITDHRRHATIDPGLATITTEEVLTAALDLLAAAETSTEATSRG